MRISSDTKRQIKSLYNKLYEIQFKPDYLCFIADNENDYTYAYYNGITLNGKKYKRLVGTNGGVKKETIVFTTEEKWQELNTRIENGRDKSKPLVPAKFEAYRALTCSGSIPVSDPLGQVIVVNDCITHFKSNIIQINDECDGEPKLEYIDDADIELNASDGFGLITPMQSEEWTSDLGEKGISSGFCIRNSFCKGMLFTFDFHEFADKIADGKSVVVDAWGAQRDIKKASIILTTSMLKLWDNYSSMEEYLQNCFQNSYSFSISKILPHELESERQLNYQFLQSYDLSDSEINQLISPTINTIKDALGMDWRKSLLFLNGSSLTNEKIVNLPSGVGKALSVCPQIIEDPYVKSVIYRMIKKTINEAKIGVLNIHANYSIVSGDCFALCESIFNMSVRGLLKAGEAYNKYWVNNINNRVVCFRAPMTSHNNIRILNINNNDECKYWYRYMPTVTVLNCWDTTTAALNGCDFDGDAVFLTDNQILLNNTKELPAIMCVQRKAEKSIITEDLLFRSNINSFGNDIGKTTNRITSMFDLQSNFSKHDPEWNTLDYRIMCGQLYQQNAIDKAKGIIAKPMPKNWYRKEKNQDDDNLCASKKPYFMRYIYSDVMGKYTKYVDNANRKCLMEFRATLDQLIQKKHKTKREKQFLEFYIKKMPVSTGNGLMNRICRIVENEFLSPLNIKCVDTSVFDYSVYKSGVICDNAYKKELLDLYLEYNQKLQRLSIESKEEHFEQDEITTKFEILKQMFKDDCDRVCPDPCQLCDILLDICYSRSSTKQFVWDICGDTIIENLLVKNGCSYTYPEKCSATNGEFTYGGEQYSMKTFNCEEKENN